MMWSRAIVKVRNDDNQTTPLPQHSAKPDAFLSGQEAEQEIITTTAGQLYSL